MTDDSLYTITIVDPATNTEVADLSKLCLARHFNVRRNSPEIIELSLHLGGAEQLATKLGMPFWGLFAVGVFELRVKRGARTLVGGKISYADPQIDASGQMLQLRATGFLDLFADRYFWDADTLTWTDDVGQVMWDFINQTQSKTNGDFGVRLGAIQTSRSLTDTWKSYATSIKDILIAISQRANSVDFEFTPDKQFNVYYPGIGQDKTDLLFSYPGNIKSLSSSRDATKLVNYSINRGSGNGNSQIVEVRQDPQPPAAYGSQNVYGLRERVDDYPSVILASTLDSYGDETLRTNASPITIPDVVLDGRKEPYLGSYWIGDRVRFAVPKRPAFSILDGQTWRINEIDVTIDQNDHEEIRLKVAYS